MAEETKIVHESCFYVWQIPTNFSNSLSSKQFGEEHLKWKLEYMADDSGYLYLHLLSAPFSTVVVHYNIDLVYAPELSLTESQYKNLNVPSDGIYEIIWHDVSPNFASIFSSTISKIFSHRQAIVLNFKELASQHNQTGSKVMNVVINIKAECKEFQHLELKEDDKLNLAGKSSISIYNFQSSRLLTSMLEDPDFTDLTIKAGSMNFKVHKSVLGSMSPVFRTLLLEKMSKNSNEIEFEFDEEALKILINFMYTGIVAIPDYRNCMELLKVAELYGLKNLKAPCSEYLIKELNQDNVIEILLNAELYGASKLKEYALEFFLKNIKKYDASDFEEITRIKPSLFPVLCSKLTEMHVDQMAQLSFKRRRK